MEEGGEREWGRAGGKGKGVEGTVGLDSFTVKIIVVMWLQ